MVVEIYPEEGFPEKTVPLVVYEGGKRIVVGEATVKGHRVTAKINGDVESKMVDAIRGQTSADWSPIINIGIGEVTLDGRI